MGCGPRGWDERLTATHRHPFSGPPAAGRQQRGAAPPPAALAAVDLGCVLWAEGAGGAA